MAEQKLHGVRVTPISGTGNVVWYTPEENIELPDPSESNVDSPTAEQSRFEEARKQTRNPK